MAYLRSSRKNLMRSTSAQIKLIVDYMAENKDFANSQGEYAGLPGARKSEAQWEALRELLKLHGVNKSVQQWKQTWRDLKLKARKAVKENRSQVPVISESIYKILETIGQVNQDCSIEIQKTEVNSNESFEWEVEPEDNSLMEDGMDDNQNGEQSDKESTRSSELEAEYIEDKNSVVEVTMPLPATDNKTLYDPLQAATTSIRLPRLAPKPHQSKSNASYSPYQRPSSSAFRRSQSPSLTRRRQLIMSRRRKTQNMFHQASSDFVTLEQQRLRMEEERDRRLHEREMERLKIELQRIEVQRNHNELLQHLVTVAQNAYDLLQQKL